ncbi:phosphoribosyltransferase [Undibacterium terreum]|uniref:Phosphoribosyltransferase n=1 Tax=Undibacterium terreum TaxID=1224302 RepID=A0A916XF52_9BURK|nr:phosphoribosyltransferase family protein [Undibacterium terreum]GGC67570.1 phosphoribosyltransferase [Undibacterium terreum]
MKNPFKGQHPGRPFKNRMHAAQLMAAKLSRYGAGSPLILAIPRGAVPMASLIAQQLHGELDVVLVHKIGAPYNSEYAIGALDESGRTYLTPYAAEAGATETYLQQEQARQVQILRERRRQYTPLRAPADPAQRVVIIVDDGLATGATMIAALHTLREKRPASLISAVPVAPRLTLEKIRPIADAVYCLHIPDHFVSVGHYYQDFTQVEDEEVIRILSSNRHH